MTEVTNGHIVSRFNAELEQLHGRVMEMGDLVHKQLKLSLEALKNKDRELAHKVVERDREVDVLELTTDKAIIRMLARRAPVGNDLRYIVAVSRTITDLERVGDEVNKVAQVLLHIEDDVDEGSMSQIGEIRSLGNLAAGLLRQSLDAFDQHNVQLANQLVHGKNGLDGEFRASLSRMMSTTLSEAPNVPLAVNMVLAIKALERVGAHARNIAAHVIYLMSGEDVRHMSEDE